MLLGSLPGPADAAGRRDRWLLQRPPAEPGPRPADARKFLRGVDAGLQVWLGGLAAAGADRVLPFLEEELCAVEEVKAVDRHLARVRFAKEAGRRCVGAQPLHALFAAPPDAPFLAFEVLLGRRARDAKRRDVAARGDDGRRDLYVRWAAPAPRGAQAARLELARTSAPGASRFPSRRDERSFDFRGL